MFKIILFILPLFLGGCESGFFGPGGSFGSETPDGEKVSCTEDLEKCSMRCEVVTKDAGTFFRTYPLKPEKCEKP